MPEPDEMALTRDSIETPEPPMSTADVAFDSEPASETSEAAPPSGSDRRASDMIVDPLSVQMVEGEVAVLGPGRFAGSLSPDAADVSATRLQEAARQARLGRQDSE